MKKDQVQQHIKSNVEQLKMEEGDSHASVGCSMVVVYKIKNKTAKFMQNFAVKVAHSFTDKQVPLVFCAEDKFAQLSEKFGDKILNGKSIPAKKIKRSYKWALVQKDFSFDSHKSILNKKALLPNNFLSYEDMALEQQIDMVTSGQLIKLIQMNNSFSFKAGDLVKNTADEISENIMCIYEFLSKQGFLIRRVYINKNMEKSKTICVRL